MAFPPSIFQIEADCLEVTSFLRKVVLSRAAFFFENSIQNISDMGKGKIQKIGRGGIPGAGEGPQGPAPLPFSGIFWDFLGAQHLGTGLEIYARCVPVGYFPFSARPIGLVKYGKKIKKG